MFNFNEVKGFLKNLLSSSFIRLLLILLVGQFIPCELINDYICKVFNEFNEFNNISWESIKSFMPFDTENFTEEKIGISITLWGLIEWLLSWDFSLVPLTMGDNSSNGVKFDKFPPNIQGMESSGVGGEGSSNQGSSNQGSSNQGSSNQGSSNQGSSNQGSSNQGSSNQGSSRGNDLNNPSAWMGKADREKADRAQRLELISTLRRLLPKDSAEYRALRTFSLSELRYQMNLAVEIALKEYNSQQVQLPSISEVFGGNIPGVGGQGTPGQASTPGVWGQGTPGQASTPGAVGQGAPSQASSPGAVGQGTPGQASSPGAGGQGTPSQSSSPVAGGQGTPGQASSPGAGGQVSSGQDS